MDPSQPVTQPDSSGLGTLVLCVVLLGLGLTILVVFLSYVLHFYHDIVRKRPTLPLGDYVRAFLWESWFSLAYVLSSPLGYLPSWPAPNGSGPPILLVHGYILNRVCMFAIFWRLRRHGFTNVYTTNLHPVFGPITEIADHLTPVLQRIAQENSSPVTVIAHSMGGVVMRVALQKEPTLPLNRVITLGTPFQGTTMAGLSRSRACSDMRIDSELLGSLSTEPAVPFVSIYSKLDNLVIPAESSEFGVRQVVLDDVGHFGLLYLEEPFDAIRRELP